MARWTQKLASWTLNVAWWTLKVVVVVEGLVVVLVLVPVVKGRFPTIVADLRYSAIVSLVGPELSEGAFRLWPPISDIRQ